MRNYAGVGQFDLAGGGMDWKIALTILAASTMLGCGDLDVVDKSKEVVISKAEYDRLKAEAALGKQVGRYQLQREGFRTWRLDTANGSICLLLTTDYDWKHGAKDQPSCMEQ